MRNPYKEVQDRFKRYLDQYFEDVKSEQSPESLVVLIMIWTTEGFRAAMQGHTKDAVGYLKEARNWLDRFIEYAPQIEKKKYKPFVFEDYEAEKGE